MHLSRHTGISAGDYSQIDPSARRAQIGSGRDPAQPALKMTAKTAHPPPAAPPGGRRTPACAPPQPQSLLRKPDLRLGCRVRQVCLVSDRPAIGAAVAAGLSGERGGGALFLEAGRESCPATAAPARRLDARLGCGSVLVVPCRPWGPTPRKWQDGLGEL